MRWLPIFACFDVGIAAIKAITVVSAPYRRAISAGSVINRIIM
jgi:hypothetical protein